MGSPDDLRQDASFSLSLNSLLLLVQKGFVRLNVLIILKAQLIAMAARAKTQGDRRNQ